MPSIKGASKIKAEGTIPKSEYTPVEKSNQADEKSPTSASEPLISPSSASTSSSSSSKDEFFSRQIFLSLVLIFPSIAPGMSLGFSAISLDQLPLTISQSSWFASIASIATPIGCLLSGPILDKFGRKPALIITGLVGLVGWLMIAYSLTITNLFIGRFITGLSVGLAATPAAIYTAESIVVKNVNLRTSLTTWSCVALTFGILNVYFMGALLRYKKVAYLAAIISGIGVALIAFIIPESPAWLNSKGRRGDAEWAAKQLRLGPPTTQTEPTSRGDAEAGQQNASDSSSNIFKEFTKPEVYKPFVIISFFFLFQQFSAVHVVIFYMVDIVRSSGFHILNPYFITVVAGIIIFASTASISVIIPQTGVKSLAAISGVGISISMFVIGLYLLFEKAPVVNFEWGFFNLIPLAALVLNVVASSIGFLPIPFTMLGEIFPVEVKGVAAGIATCLAYIFSFLAIKTYPYLHIMLGNGIFFFYGLVAAIGTAHIMAYLPETKGKSLEEILKSFSK